VSTGFAIALACGLAVLAWILLPPMFAARRRGKLVERSLTAAERASLAEYWPGYARVPPALAPRLDALAAVFAAEKDFVGCGGLAVTPPMRLAIAAQACLLAVGHEGLPYESLRSVLVYPSQFVVPGEWHDEDGVVTEESRVLAGESWEVSRVILSWEDVDSRGAPGEAYNVVFHEFAHYLDHESGGAPWIAGDDARRRWTQVLDQELERVRAQAEAGEQSFLDPYAAEDRGEFFAVASEAFFEEPALFARELPVLYRALSDAYRLDPAAW
jgi:Mlc titration factor MtfA (ptsG expression regulator)